MIPKDAIRTSVTDEERAVDGTNVPTGRKILGAHVRLDEWTSLDPDVYHEHGDRVLEDLKHRLRVALWRDIYGDIKDRVVRLRMEAIANIPPWKADRAEQLLNELLGMLADPEKPKEDR